MSSLYLKKQTTLLMIRNEKSLHYLAVKRHPYYQEE